MNLITLGIAVICIGIVMVMVGTLLTVTQPEGQEPHVRSGGVILVGPIPIVFGSDRTMLWVSIAGAALFLAAYYVWRTR